MRVDKHGQGDISVVLVHGGPSLFGYMISLGELLKDDCQILDYAQRGTFENPCRSEDISIDHHLQDLDFVVESANTKDVILIGHSWGADLALLYASRFPKKLKKVIVLGLAPLDEEIGNEFGRRLDDRLTLEQRKEVDRLENLFQEAKASKAQTALRQKRLDVMTPLYNFDQNSVRLLPACKWNYETFKISINALWNLIEVNEIKDILTSIEVPVVAFHGEHDPIPMEQTERFLKKHLRQFEFEAFSKAGHFIWVEPHAKDHFLNRLRLAIHS